MTVDEILAAQDEIMAGAESRELTADEVQRYEGLETDLVEARRRAGLAERHAAARAAVTPPIQTAVSGASDDGDEEFRSFLQTASTPGAAVLTRAQSEGTASAGGYTVPETFRNKIVERMKAFGGVASVAEVITTADGRPMEWMTNDDTGNTGAIVAENGAPAGGADLVFGQKTLGAYKYMAVGASGLALKVPVELLQDSAINLQDFIARKLGERIARAQATHLVTGNGTTQPLGLTTGITPIELGTALSYAHLLTVVHSVDPEYRANAAWMFNDATLKAIHGLVDGNGRPLLNASVDGITGRPAMSLLGYPIVIDQAFSTYDAADDDLPMGAFGDFREGYVIRRVRDVQMIVDPLTYSLNAQVGFIAWARMDATQNNTNAYVVFSGAEA